MRTTGYEEMVDFIAAGPSAQRVATFSVSKSVRQRVTALIDREKHGEASDEERSELHHDLELEHLMRLAKARARGHLDAA